MISLITMNYHHRLTIISFQIAVISLKIQGNFTFLLFSLNNYRYLNSICRELLLITTLDGKISALDIEKHGELSWSRDTGPGGLLSSTISNYEITKKGQIVRVIPSLDGNLYLFNGNSIESIPMSTESLLKSSYKVGDDLVVSGGQENKIYGINILTGELYYECGMAGCPKSETIENETNQDLVLIKQITQTVRAIEAKTGKEKWHFSVGNMHINMPHTDDCQSDKLKNNTNDDIILKVIVPDGLVTAQKDALQDAWDHKFETPIVNIWHFKNGHLKSINLFDNKKLYGFESFIKDFGIKSSSPEIYVGLHNRQWYIQMNNEMIEEKQEENKKGNDVFVLTSEQLSSQYQLLKIDWQQNNKTESLNQNNKEHQVNSNSVQITSKLFEILSYNLQTAGYYFVPHNSTVCSVNQTINNTTKTDPKTKDKCYISYTVKDENGISNLVTISICDHWMEIVLIFFVLWISLNFIVCKIKMLFWKTSCQQVQFVSFEILPPEQKEQKQQIMQQQHSNSQSDDHETRTRRSISTNSNASGDGNGAVYSSRYLDDFEQIRLLGKGGFGVVFEAKHKIDENHYAIKRISLPMKKEHRDKVKREVKALSKLDHIGIVRYFYTWEETPPEGWQEQMDKEWYDSGASTKSKLWKFNHNKESKIKNGNIKNEKEQRNGYKLFNDDNKDVISFDDGELNHKDKSNNTSSYVAFVNSQSERNNNEGKATTEKIHQHSEEELNDEKYQEIKSINSGDYKRAYLYIQMQLCRKDTLRHWLLNNSMQRDKNIVFDIFVQIIDAVDYVHSMGLMHRDLKVKYYFILFLFCI